MRKESVANVARRREREKQIIEAVAGYVESFDGVVLHQWRLSDCIRAKFNLYPGKKWMRKNPNGWRGSTAPKEGL